jgi:diguanylate cyclase
VDDFDLFADNESGLTTAVLTQKSLIDTQERLGCMLDVMPMGLLIHTQQGILFANQEACGLMKVEHDRVVGRHFLDFVRSTEMDEVSAQFRISFGRGRQTIDHETVLLRPDGTERLVRLISGPLPWEGNPVIQILLQDVTDQKRAEQSLRQMTITDELTGAYNRRHLFYEATLYVGSVPSRRIPLSIILMDIDHFKRINDTFGHGKGDEALKALTNLVQGILPTIRGADSAMFARIGGEEFVVLLPGFSVSAASKLSEQIRAQIECLRIGALGGPIAVTASMGVATYRSEDHHFDGLLVRADAALYQAKASGRNRVHVAL